MDLCLKHDFEDDCHAIPLSAFFGHSGTHYYYTCDQSTKNLQLQSMKDASLCGIGITSLKRVHTHAGSKDVAVDHEIILASSLAQFVWEFPCLWNVPLASTSTNKLMRSTNGLFHAFCGHYNQYP